MQQFATTQTSIAASKLPFEDVQQSSPIARGANGSTFNNNTQNDSKNVAQNHANSDVKNDTQKRAFEDALARQEQRSQNEARGARAEADTRHEASSDVQKNSNERNEDSKREDSKRIVQRNSIDEAQQTDDFAKANAASSDTKPKTIGIKDDAEVSLASDLANRATPIDENLADDFDWVAYVNQVKELTAASDNIPNDLHIKDKKAELDIFAQTMNSINKGAVQNDTEENSLNPDIAKIDIVNAQTDPEFLEISLSEKELAALINAAGGNADDQLGLNSEAMAALDKAIARLLNQLLSKEEKVSAAATNSGSAETIESADANLLKDLLKASAVENGEVAATKDEQKFAYSVPAASTQTLQEVTAEETANLNDKLEVEKKRINAEQIETDLSATKLSPKSGPDALLVAKPVTPTQDNAVALEGSGAAVDAELSLNLLPELEKAPKPIDSPLLVPIDTVSNKKQVERLAKLPPEIEASAIDNIALRVEAVVSEIKSEGKSADFIAALQSGVKEMKDQLKQGREPGIDLKTLVSDALTASDVNVSANVEVALDKQLSQVTHILGAAASLSQSTQQHNYLNTGLTEVQAIKEVSQQQMESSRLAQQTAVNDKGVNIFKPEGQQQLTEKVRWMVNSRNLSAEIRLDPADLGGMNIKVNLSGDSASVSFVVQTQHARDALDQAVPRLREMLEEQGIELGQSSVQQDSSGSNEQADQESLANNSDGSNNLAQQSQEQDNEEYLGDSENILEQRINGGRIGGIDYYA